MPMRNLISILGATALGVWAYFGVIERLNNIETRATLFEADLLKAADQKPIDQEQYMLLEFTATQLEKVTTEMESMMNNRVNIDFLKKQVDKLQKDVEELGPDKFTREILHFCPSRGVLSYLEAKEQFDRRVLEKDEYYNGIINVRVGGSNILRQTLKEIIGDPNSTQG